MNTPNKIFSKSKIGISSKNVVQKVKYNREQLLSRETAYELNTYLNFGIFPTFADTQVPYYKDGKEVDPPPTNGVRTGIGTPGARSIFNKSGAVILGSSNGNYNVDLTDGAAVNSWRIANNVPLIDSPKARQRIRQSAGCSVRELVEASQNGSMGQETYAYSDFMYCKHLGKVPNNYMITLRRFPVPVGDYIGGTGESPEHRVAHAAKNAVPVGCMVTWFGVSGNDLSSILKYSYKMPFKSVDAEWQDKQGDADQNQNVLNGIFSAFDSKYREQYMAGYAGEAANKMFEHFGIKSLGNPPYKNHAGFRDKNKVYGPVDAVKTTYMRAETGLTFDQKISLVFEYELRAYNGINPKQAMLDLLSNILNVTYTTGSFWGGGFKGFAAHQSNIFTNLECFKCRGGFTDFIDAFAKDISTIGKKINNSFGNNPMEAIKSALNNIGGMLLSGMLNKLGRPQKTMYNSLLSPAPVGFWHVTIGNPKRPIMSIGNMIITNVSVEHNGPLGIDDFPTGLKVTVELERGKPRDLRDIEKLYMQGTDRIYSSMSDKVFDMYKNSELYKSTRTNPDSYNPVTEPANVDLDKSTPTVTVKDYDKIKKSMMKYFGTVDSYSIYFVASEQEWGAGKKRPPKNNGDGEEEEIE